MFFFFFREKPTSFGHSAEPNGNMQAIWVNLNQSQQRWDPFVLCKMPTNWFRVSATKPRQSAVGCNFVLGDCTVQTCEQVCAGSLEKDKYKNIARWDRLKTSIHIVHASALNEAFTQYQVGLKLGSFVHMCLFLSGFQTLPSFGRFPLSTRFWRLLNSGEP